MNYKIIDLENWERKDLYKLYTSDLKIVMNLTVEIDVTNLVNFTKKFGYKFYPCMIWAVSKIVNSRDEFKYAKKDGKLIKWDYVSPSFTDFNIETQKFNKFVTEYSSDFNVFYTACQTDREKNKNIVGFIDNQPENVFDITCLPWVYYKNFTMHIETEQRFFPVVSWGKYVFENGAYKMPVTIDFNHAVGDGFHASRFFNELQEFISNFADNALESIVF
ncbi:MAG: chloramphenicol acetyltransferase [Clostridiales bacterium]|nr:chloramphenicol acetyltransferase [Clostridiales bacterium]